MNNENARKAAGTELRFRSLLLTVSGDYDLSQIPAWVLEMSRPWRRASEASSVYAAALLGAADPVFGLKNLDHELQEAIFHYKKDASILMPLAMLCVDSAVWEKAHALRPGIRALRKSAFSAILAEDELRLTHTMWGDLERRWILKTMDDVPSPAVSGAGTGAAVSGAETAVPASEPLHPDSFFEHAARYALPEGVLIGRRRVYTPDERLEIIRGAKRAETARDLITTALYLYKSFSEEGFADRLKGTHDLGRSSVGRDFGSAKDNLGKQYKEDLILSLSPSESSEDQAQSGVFTTQLVLDDEAMARVERSVEISYGLSYLTKREQEHMEKLLCSGPHAGSHLHFTDGIPESGLLDNPDMFQFRQRITEANRELYEKNRLTARQSIRALASSFRNAMAAREEKERISASHGILRPDRLWNLGRTDNENLFDRELIRDDSAFVVDLLIDASGSQQVRQSMVALQGYIFSEALSMAGIPHRVMSFCTFGDYTVMRRFRDYDDIAAKNARLFEYYGSGNNRDGLAIRAAGLQLMKRPEENHLMIVLSDGMPNDIIVSRKRAKLFPSYSGDYAVRDTSLEIRALRRAGARVMGIFVGDESSLQDERLAFGTEFAHIRSIESFAATAAGFIKRELEE